MATSREIATGRVLNKRWNIGARHALYRENGTWYHQLRSFPGALIDRNGYVLFKTKGEYRAAPGLQIRKQVSCPKGISSLPNYIRVAGESGSAQRIPASADIKRAFSQYVAGERPWREVQRDWFVVGSDGTLYPAKYIWALATKRAPKSFNTRDARRALSDQGLTLVSERQLKSDESVQFARRVHDALKLSDEELQARAKNSNKLPTRRMSAVHIFSRNQYVAAAVLRRAKGRCETCTKPAPFIATATRAPYLEIHHRVRLADGGKDTIENTIAVCPNCHRQAHYG